MTGWMVWYGHLSTSRRLRLTGMLLLSGSMVWLLTLLVLPFLVVAVMAFAGRSQYGEVRWAFTLENMWRLLGFGILEWSADYLLILARSVWVALVTTAVAVLLSYPLAFFIAARKPATRYVLLGLIIVPFCTNLVVRTYAWMLILGPGMPLTWLAQHLALVPPGQALYPGAFAVYLGMVGTFLPFAILPLYTNVERLDWSIVEAAQDLYASRTRIFMHALLPQTLPGLTAGIILTFIPAMGAFVVPDLLGGAKYMLVGNLIQQQFGPSRDWPFGSAVSLALMILTLAGLFLLGRWGKEVRPA